VLLNDILSLCSDFVDRQSINLSRFSSSLRPFLPLCFRVSCWGTIPETLHAAYCSEVVITTRHQTSRHGHESIERERMEGRWKEEREREGKGERTVVDIRGLPMAR
jgi:hypothetical protein